jgi:C-3',4' desaturase CrtD
MAYEVVVVGGGIGGLTVAALLAARGVKVCLLERESRVGGCAASFEKFAYSFEQGAGLYALWQPDEIHDRVFSELPVDPPEARRLESAYIVRLPDQSEVPLTTDTELFEDSLRKVFPECAVQAIRFYRELNLVGRALRHAVKRVPDLRTAGRIRRYSAFLPELMLAPRIVRSMKQSAGHHLAGTSLRFRRFVDVQLQALAQSSSEHCAYLHATIALSVPREGMFSIRGGASTLAERLAESIRKSGGTIRLDTPVLRLAYDGAGTAVGVDLLSGETVAASRAIVSNLTVWDTYGKLIGLNRTPSEVRKRLGTLRGWGAYLLFLGMDEATAERMPSDHILALADWQNDQDYDPENSQLMFAAAPAWDTKAPEGKRAVTVHAFTDVEQWFTYHEDETEHERKDQLTLEACWEQLHKMIPELGDGIEVIDTATPRTTYDLTRRKLGMVGGLSQSLNVFGLNSISHLTSLPNVFLVGDTTFPGSGIAAVTLSALVVANHLRALLDDER